MWRRNKTKPDRYHREVSGKLLTIVKHGNGLFTCYLKGFKAETVKGREAVERWFIVRLPRQARSAFPKRKPEVPKPVAKTVARDWYATDDYRAYCRAVGAPLLAPETRRVYSGRPPRPASTRPATGLEMDAVCLGFMTPKA